MAKPLTRLTIVLPVTEASRIRKAARRQQLAVSRFIRHAVARIATNRKQKSK